MWSLLFFFYLALWSNMYNKERVKKDGLNCPPCCHFTAKLPFAIGFLVIRSSRFCCLVLARTAYKNILQVFFTSEVFRVHRWHSTEKGNAKRTADISLYDQTQIIWVHLTSVMCSLWMNWKWEKFQPLLLVLGYFFQSELQHTVCLLQMTWIPGLPGLRVHQ